jgi:hypothetical protein
VREQVQRCPAAEPYCGHRVQLLTNVAERRLEAEGKEHDAGNHRQVEVGVGVAREPRPLEAARLREPSAREDRGHVEVEPPEHRDHHNSKRRRPDLSDAEVEPGADTDGIHPPSAIRMISPCRSAKCSGATRQPRPMPITAGPR